MNVPTIKELAMSTNIAYPAPRREKAGPGRVLAIVASVFLLVIGAGLVIGGTTLVAVFGSDGEISSATHPVRTPTAAVVTDVAAIRDTSELADALGTPVARITADGGFVGIGPAAEVDRYLAGVEIDQAADFDLDPFVLVLSRRDGTEPTAEPPAEQEFWVASSTGSTHLSWPVRDGDYRVVVMNTDGAAGVDTQLSVGVGLGSVFEVGLSMMIGGAALIVLAIALLVFTRPRRLPPAAPGFADRYVLPPTAPVPETAPPVRDAPDQRPSHS